MKSRSSSLALASRSLKRSSFPNRSLFSLSNLQSSLTNATAKLDEKEVAETLRLVGVRTTRRDDKDGGVPSTAFRFPLGGPTKAAEASRKLVSDMLAALGNYTTGGVEAMRLGDYWHPRFSWYGPSGIGTGRGLSGFRDWHQIPFLNAMPDRVGTLGKGDLFGDGDYVGFTAWPGMRATITGDGWLGIAPSGQKITMRSLDFWRCENGLIRENWVLVDILDVFRQIGVDVFARMREFGKARMPG